MVRGILMDAMANCLPGAPANIAVRKVSQAQAAQQLALDITQQLRAAIAARGRAVLSVSGGRSPVALFEALRVQRLDWSRVFVTLVDERCVPVTHAHSNALLVGTYLLQGPAVAARWVPMLGTRTEPLPAPEELALHANTALLETGVADVTVLGMGVDGHTASLFPEATNLGAAMDPSNPDACMAMVLPTAPANAPYPRISQTLAHLLRSRAIVLSLAGADKLQTLAQAWATPRARLPIARILHQTKTPVALWIST
jgi:6-phosphogluconolactonase